MDKAECSVGLDLALSDDHFDYRYMSGIDGLFTDSRPSHTHDLYDLNDGAIAYALPKVPL